MQAAITHASSGRTEEQDMLRDYDPGRSPSYAGNYVWETDEEVSRRVVLIGRAAVDPDVIVARLEGEEKTVWVMACGSSYDGKIIGRELTIRRRLRDVREVTSGLSLAEIIAIARQRVADRYAQPYHKSAILSGEWDMGSVVRSEIEEVTREVRNA